MIKTILLALIVMINLLQLSAQTTVFPSEIYTQKNGLPGNEVNSILQDDYGFLWIGTNKGLCRYDGYRFEEIEFNAKSTAYGYKQPSVNQLFIDKKDNIRFKNGSSLYVYDKVNTPVPDQTFQLGLTKDNKKKIIQILHNEGGNIWVAYAEEDSLGYYHHDLKRFKNYALSRAMNNKEGGRKTIKFIDKKNNVWLQGDSTTLYRGTLNAEETRISWQTSTSTEKFNYTMIDDDEGNIYAYKSQILKFDQETNQFVPYLTAKTLREQGVNVIKTMLVDESQIFMVSYDDRVFMYNIQSHDFQIISDTLNSNVNTIFRTSSGTIWLGTSEGLIKLSQVFHWNYLLHNSNSITSSRQEVISIFQDKQGRTWLGTANNGIIQFDPEGVSKSYYLQHSVNAIVQDWSNQIWAGGSTLGQAAIYQLDEIQDIFKPAKDWTTRYPDLGEFEFQTITTSTTPQLWAGGKGQLLKMNLSLDSLVVTYLLAACNDPDYAQEFATVNVILEDSEHHLWLAANGSKTYLYYFDPIKNKFDCLHPFLNKDESYPIYTIQETYNTLWLGTEGGLIEIDKLGRKVLHHYTTKSGLPTDKICSILTDQLGNLWISTLKGLSYFNVSSREFNNFGLEEMLGIETFHEQAAYKNEQTGELFFGGINGAVSFHPDSLLKFIKSVPLPQVLITRMAVFGEPVSTQRPIYEQEEVLLDKGEDYFELEFMVPHPGNLNCRYRYKLEGIEEEWNYTTQFQNVNYKNLQPGTYQFQVQARSFTNNWEDNSKSLKITIKPYFYQTNFFRVALFLAICSVIGGVIYFRFRFLKLEKETQEKELQRKTALLKALSSQMNPHFLYNSLNSINNFIANQDKRKANEYLADFATLMRMILNHSKLEQISLKKELECLELYLKLEHLRAGHKFDYSVNVDKIINTSDIFVPPMIIQPFIENAIWHGLHHKKEKGHLDLIVNQINGHIVCHVIDDGIGIKKSQELQAGKTRVSTGIENVQERLRILNGIDQQGLKLEIKEPITGGTHIEITIAAV